MDQKHNITSKLTAAATVVASTAKQGVDSVSEKVKVGVDIATAKGKEIDEKHNISTKMKEVVAKATTTAKTLTGVDGGGVEKVKEGEAGVEKELFLTGDRRADFCKYITQINEDKLKNFLLRFDFAQQAMVSQQISLLYHALIALYCRP
eukprot:UN32034